MTRQLDYLDGRRHNWEKASLFERRCPFCGSEGSDRYIRPDGLHVRHCMTCHCYFISPCPTQEELTTFYSKYFSHHRKSEFQKYLNDPILVKEMLFLDPLSDVKVRTIKSLIDLRGKRVLDVGFGMGQNLIFFNKLGAKVAGLDVDPDAADFVRSKLNFQNVSTGDIQTFNTAAVYDLVTLHDVIEHPLDPLRVLQNARSMLSSGGLLSIWTPNASFVDAESQPIAFRVDLEHLQYLTFDTIRYITSILGMTITHLGTYGFPRLENIRRLSGKGPGLKHLLRPMVRSLPGFVQANALLKRLGSRDSGSGTYHLFCVLKNNA